MKKILVSVFITGLSLALFTSCGDKGVVEAPAPSTPVTASNR